MDNATRKELLYRARAAGYPGSILDVYANYDQGKDIIAEFQDQQRHQQMSQMASQQSGLQQGGQQPQMDMQPQPVAMPAIPSSPTPSPNFTPPQPPQPIGVQSQDAPTGIVSGQSGPNQARAIFATGGFTEGDPIKDAMQFSKNPELFAKAKAMGHNSIEEYKASNWGYGPNISNKKSIGIPKDKLYNYLVAKQDSVSENRLNGLNDNDVAALGFAIKEEESVPETAKKILSGEFFKQVPKVTNIPLTTGRFNTGKVPSNVVDALIGAANRQGIDPYTMLGVAGRESTLGIGYNSNENKNLRTLVSGWNVDEPYLPYKVNRFLADKKVPGVVSKKDFHGWDFSIQDTEAVNNYLEKHPEVINQYLKKVRNTPELNNFTTLDLTAQKIKREGVANYNPGDSKYAQMVQDDINTLKKDPELSKYLNSKGIKKLGGPICYTCVGRKRRV